MAFVSARGLWFHVVDLCRPEVPADAPPVVMLHGLFTGSSASFYFTIAPKIAQHRRVVLIDLRGHGRTDQPPDGYGSVNLADDVLEVIDQLVEPHRPVDLVGHSFGAIVAMRAAQLAPHRIGSIAMIDPPLAPADGHRWLVSGFSADVLGRGAGAGSPVDDSAGVRALAAARSLTIHTSLLDDLRVEPAVNDVELARLARDHHLLTVFGNRSPWSAAAQRVCDVAFDAEVCVLPGGHQLHVDARDALGSRLIGFLSCPASSGAPGLSCPPSSGALRASHDADLAARPGGLPRLRPTAGSAPAHTRPLPGLRPAGALRSSRHAPHPTTAMPRPPSWDAIRASHHAARPGRAPRPLLDLTAIEAAEAADAEQAVAHG